MSIGATGLAPRDRGRAGEGGFDDPGLLFVMDVERALGRAGSLRPTDVADAAAGQLPQARLHVAPGSHVARLFLQPDQLLGIRILLDGGANGGVLERRELLD